MTLSGEKLWRAMTHLWTVFFMFVIVVNFFGHDRFEFLIAPFSAIYISILGLYVSTKEFDRWYEMHHSRHPGEIFVFIWTVIILMLLGISGFFKNGYHLSTEAVAVYIMVLSVFALTQKSKAMHARKLARRRSK